MVQQSVKTPRASWFCSAAVIYVTVCNVLPLLLGDNASTVTTTVPTPTEFTGTATNDSILPSEADIGHLSTEWPGNAPSGHMEATDWSKTFE